MEKQKQITVSLKGRIPSKKNSKQMIHAKGRVFFIPSKQYAEWHREQSKELTETKRLKSAQLPIQEATIEMKITFPDNIRADLTNKAESVMDLLVDNGILEDDNHKVCKKVVIESGGVDKQNAGVRITITY